MIRNSFIFLERIGDRLERDIWRQGIYNWDEFLKRKSIRGISKLKKLYYDRKITKARKNLYYNNSYYFTDILPNTETWRLYNYFKEEAVFLDIETTGLSDYSYLTLIGLFDGQYTKTMIRGINFNVKSLKEELRKYKLIITFNGASFDLPYINKRFPDLVPDIIPHWDLRFSCCKIGLSGGLKNIEKALGIRRGKIVKDMNGGDAILLWRKYQATGDEYYLKLLVEYNEEDIINLKQIAEHVYEELKRNYSPSNSINLKNL